MTDETVELSTPRGTMPVHLYRPDGDVQAPLVVLYMDAGGIRPVLHAHARRLVKAGYAAALPDLYYTIDPADRPDPAKLAARDEAEFKRMGAVVGRMNDETVLEDTRLLLDGLPEGPPARFGCVGFCMGGRFGLRAAETFGVQLGAASLLHPSRLVTDTPDSPHLAVEGVRGGLYLGFGENDHVTPVGSIPPLRDALEEHGIEHRIDVLAGADHGYTMPDAPAYHEAAAEQAWAATLALFDSSLR